MTEILPYYDMVVRMKEKLTLTRDKHQVKAAVFEVEVTNPKGISLIGHTARKGGGDRQSVGVGNDK
ncbi:conserved domain protein [Paenibacillus sp. HGF5]|nr:conserved domain protein [Paenibacillus sp. HGF5]